MMLKSQTHPIHPPAVPIQTGRKLTETEMATLWAGMACAEGHHKGAPRTLHPDPGESYRARVLQAIRDLGQGNYTEIEAKAGVSNAAVRNWVTKLEAEGLIKCLSKPKQWERIYGVVE